MIRDRLTNRGNGLLGMPTSLAERIRHLILDGHFALIPLGVYLLSIFHVVDPRFPLRTAFYLPHAMRQEDSGFFHQHHSDGRDIPLPPVLELRPFNPLIEGAERRSAVDLIIEFFVLDTR